MPKFTKNKVSNEEIDTNCDLEDKHFSRVNLKLYLTLDVIFISKLIQTTCGLFKNEYSRMGQVKFGEDSL